jgi:hypothetical protein
VRISKVFLDDREVSMALAGSKIPVDPGSHRVEVRREGTTTYEMDVELAEAESHKLEIEINDPKPTVEPDPVPDPVPQPQPIPREPETEMKRLPAYILGGVGVLSFVGAGIFWGLRQSHVSAIAESCEDPNNLVGCDPANRDLEETAQSFDVASKVLVSLGAVSLATGVVLWFVLTPDDGSPTTGAQQPSVTFVPTLGGFAVLGTF